MSIEYTSEDLLGILNELRNLPNETEWVEFKHNNSNPEKIGQYISALSNSAALLGKITAYIVWGIEDGSHEVVGTTFKPTSKKIKKEELENWLLRQLTPKLNFRFHEFEANGKHVVILEIPAVFSHPVQFNGIEHVRIGSYTKKLKDYPGKERTLWRILENTPFEREIAAEKIDAGEVLSLLDYPAYFALLSLHLPENRESILESLNESDMITLRTDGTCNITNLGAILFAKDISNFPFLKRKAVRVIQYKGNNRLEKIHEREVTKGYASGFKGLIGFITNLIPSNEVLGKALRKDVPMFPNIAIRELVANAIIHQNFHVGGTSPMIEIFSDRIEFTNPGLPLVNVDRFLDSPPKSRNESLASFMRLIGVCEERGSGIDKVVFETELYQLPAPLVETTDEHTRVVLFAHKDFNDMDTREKVRACYLHTCLKYVQREFMTNSSLRKRFGIEAKNSATVSRVIKWTINDGLINPYDQNVGNRAMKYKPWWA